ncbi:uncharacterized protein TNCV_1195551 [Trichonephila clavipes]|nr:uncharacterized protein TNCV_1195551 [Trichonephila clavipes]
MLLLCIIALSCNRIALDFLLESDSHILSSIFVNASLSTRRPGAQKIPDKLDFTRFSGYKFLCSNAKWGCRSCEPRARNELKSTLALALRSTRGLLATDPVILNHGQVTWTTPELAPPLLTTTPHQREDVSALDRFNVHRCPTRRIFSGTGLELVTRPHGPSEKDLFTSSVLKSVDFSTNFQKNSEGSKLATMSTKMVVKSPTWLPKMMATCLY